jgi:SAM-dependent methyltransferase
MHTQVLDWVGQFRTLEDLSVLDIGGRDLNGSTRMFFPNANPYHVLDILPGTGVDFVADAADWRQPEGRQYDLVLSTETFEHAKRWPEIIKTAWDVLRPGGWFIFTCAGPGRPPHSGVAAVWELSPGEWYENVSAGQIAEVLLEQGWEGIDVRQVGLDTQGKAVKPPPVPPILHVEQLTEVKRGEPREVLFGAVLSRTSAGR